MKKLFCITFLLIAGSIVHANDETAEILKNSIVSSTLKLMQSKHDGQCEDLSEKNINFMCGGLLFPTNKLELKRNSCGIRVEIICPTEIALLYGEKGTVHAEDGSGYRKDVEELHLGLTFRELRFEKIKNADTDADEDEE